MFLCNMIDNYTEYSEQWCDNVKGKYEQEIRKSFKIMYSQNTNLVKKN